MAPSDVRPYGWSTNSLSQELDVHLNVFLQFLNTGGCPAKFDEATGQYTSQHLRKLAAWIDSEPEPVRIY